MDHHAGPDGIGAIDEYDRGDPPPVRSGLEIAYPVLLPHISGCRAGRFRSFGRSAELHLARDDDLGRRGSGSAAGGGATIALPYQFFAERHGERLDYWGRPLGGGWNTAGLHPTGAARTTCEEESR
jgi:hypothetical protein